MQKLCDKLNGKRKIRKGVGGMRKREKQERGERKRRYR